MIEMSFLLTVEFNKNPFFSKWANELFVWISIGENPFDYPIPNKPFHSTMNDVRHIVLIPKGNSQISNFFSVRSFCTQYIICVYRKGKCEFIQTTYRIGFFFIPFGTNWNWKWVIFPLRANILFTPKRSTQISSQFFFHWNFQFTWILLVIFPLLISGRTNEFNFILYAVRDENRHTVKHTYKEKDLRIKSIFFFWFIQVFMSAIEKLIQWINKILK